MTGHITIYAKDHGVLNWRAFYSKKGCKTVMDIWIKQYGDQVAYFQIYARPYNEKVIIEPEKQVLVRPKSVYQNLPIYNYKK